MLMTTAPCSLNLSLISLYEHGNLYAGLTNGCKQATANEIVEKRYCLTN